MAQLEMLLKQNFLEIGEVLLALLSDTTSQSQSQSCLVHRFKAMNVGKVGNRIKWECQSPLFGQLQDTP